MNIPVRDFDPKKDLVNPTFKIKMAGLSIKIYLSNLRNLFRKWLYTTGNIWLKSQTNQSTVIKFLEDKNIEMSKADIKKLIICFTIDITRKKLGFPYGVLTGKLLLKWNNYQSNT